MIALIIAFAAVSLLLLPLTHRLGRSVFLVAALVPAAAFIYTLGQGATVLGGTVVAERYAWVPQLDLAVSVRLDPLSWALSLVVAGVGTLVLLYCARYFHHDEAHLGRFAATLLAFAGAMYGLVLADDVYLLFVFWEATSVLSYLLIGHYTERKASRGAALQALLVTTLGGLAMLVGLVMLATETGTSSLSAIVAADHEGALAITAMLLVLVGALSKSAIFPFHFWLPAAMAAPTPVSAYLHAAAMVKAGIYLIARMAPGFAEVPLWRETLVILGVFTMLLGGWTALKQTDLKLVLAHGTVSQLGFLTIVIGFGSRDTALAGLALLLAHALFKSTLFLVVGIIDHRAGTRDLRRLSGLGREAPRLAIIAALALLSMAGLPPLAGFVAKEAVFTSLLEEATAGAALGWVALIGVTLGSILTVAYSARFFWGAFFSKRDVETVRPVDENIDFLFAPAVLAVSGLVLGIFPAVMDVSAAAYSESFPPGSGESYHLALWHGLEPALAFSAATLVLGAALFMLRGRRIAQNGSLGRFSAAAGYGRVMGAIDRTAARTTGLTQRGSLPFYLGVILSMLVGTVGLAAILNRSWPTDIRLWDFPAQLAIGLVMIIASLAATRATKRFQAVVLVGVTGLGMSALFALSGAPDLALTQILVETMTLVAFVLVLRRLPARLGVQNGSGHRVVRAIIAIAVGTLMAVVAVVATGARTALPISLAWPKLAYEQGHGSNTVNVALVDLRGWDTMGELSVVIAAATGVASLIFLRSRTETAVRPTRTTTFTKIRATLESPTASGRGSWLLAGRTLDARNRSILLEVVVRLIFHSLMVLSIYLLFAGHNAPGGGFAAGLVAGLAFAARYLAGGREELAAATPLDAGKLLGAGLTLAVGTALVPLFFGVDALTSTWVSGHVWLFGELEFVTSTIFDIGVYFVVIGLALDVLRSLGSEVDRQQEEDLAVKS
ncbi:multisubunit sodium/proton antiporter MrpA subunit /multisubunit sodium/proton antiporter MrpB subunit [Glaciihabitans tibetensis]|uniref:Multisubunit sodium/proton antiporter MrpA subunit /multisubunit sodium/proton antiporter MrpB subunit n=1 Tax=Glaciihabitans tibetensis TaxID=1266600 RepID=A0A2T0VFR7_9MICO|nr:Na+/H+ antiporter subunit A [Glaciihabitans tibetensis]PRY69016.1 multisubunit sodium/proton antiporter MrpA subunit /multisubunit sodium/proton antiporter MrpB subunit [Glaciihabitans tibetensis]